MEPTINTRLSATKADRIISNGARALRSLRTSICLIPAGITMSYARTSGNQDAYELMRAGFDAVCQCHCDRMGGKMEACKKPKARIGGLRERAFVCAFLWAYAGVQGLLAWHKLSQTLPANISAFVLGLASIEGKHQVPPQFAVKPQSHLHSVAGTQNTSGGDASGDPGIPAFSQSSNRVGPFCRLHTLVCQYIRSIIDTLSSSPNKTVCQVIVSNHECERGTLSIQSMAVACVADFIDIYQGQLSHANHENPVVFPFLHDVAAKDIASEA